MNASGKQLIAFWLHKKGEKWMVQSLDKSESEDVFPNRKCGLYHYITPTNKFKSCMIIRLKNVGQEISNILHLLQAKNKKVVHLETRIVQDSFQMYIEIESSSNKDWNEIRNILETLNGIEIEAVEDRSPEYETPGKNIDLGETTWFPRRITDLDHFQKVYMAGTDLQADHPGFNDEVYRKRRKMFTEIAMFYKQGEKIPIIKYTEEEKKTWKTIFNELRHLHKLYATKEYLKNWEELIKYCGYREDNIPQLEDINFYLKKKTGFQVRPVAGYLSPRDFLGGLAFRVFHCTQYIRHSSDPFYTPEPDCCHEILGHMPMLADSNFAQFSQEIGLASLGASEADLKKLAACYFFTVEFGLCKEDGTTKIYGAGLLSSVAEINHVIKGIKNESIDVSKFSIEEVNKTECMVTTYQNRYFYTDTMDDAKQELRQLALTIKRPFEVRYNPYTQCIDTLSTSGEILDAAQELQGDVCLIANAVKKMKDKGDYVNLQGLSAILDLKTNIINVK